VKNTFFPRNLLTIFPSASSAFVNIGFLVEDYERIHNSSKVSKRDGFKIYSRFFPLLFNETFSKAIVLSTIPAGRIYRHFRF